MLRFRNLIDALDAAPANRPFVTAWIDEDERETVTFEEFRRRARWQAAVLREQHVGAGDRVIVIMPQGIGAMAAFVGAMMLGAVPAFLAYPNFKVEPAKYRSGLAGVTANLNARAVVIDDEFPEEMLGHVSLNEETKLICAKQGRAVGEDKEFLPTETKASDLAFIQHSAGTTGLQKGVALTHTAVLRQIEHLAQALSIDGRTDRVYTWLPLYHDMGLIACFILPMVCQQALTLIGCVYLILAPKAGSEGWQSIVDDICCSKTFKDYIHCASRPVLCWEVPASRGLGKTVESSGAGADDLVQAHAINQDVAG